MDDLTQIKGIGKATAKKLAEAGIDSFAALGGLQVDNAALASIEADSKKRAGWIAAALEMPAAIGEDDGNDGSTDASQADQGGGSVPEPGAPAAPLPEAYRQEYPLLSALIEAWRAAHPDAAPSIVRIRSRREGFRRCNIAHSKAPTDHPADRFTPDEMERLLAEPVLTVELA